MQPQHFCPKGKIANKTHVVEGLTALETERREDFGPQRHLRGLDTSQVGDFLSMLQVTVKNLKGTVVLHSQTSLLRLEDMEEMVVNDVIPMVVVLHKTGSLDVVAANLGQLAA